MKKLYYLIVLALILGLVLTGCSLLSNIGQAPATGQSGVTYLTKALPLTSLVGLWHFDGNADDSSGNGLHGNVTGAAFYVDGKFDKALSFNGIDDYVKVSDSASLDVTDYTIELWVKANNFEYIYPTLLNHKVQKYTEGYYWIWIKSGYIVLTYSNGTIAKSQYWYTSFSPGEWYHIALTKSGSSFTMYKNFNSLGTKDLTYVDSAGGDLFIGTYQGRINSRYNFDGTIDEVRIWNVALSKDQLGKVYEFDGFFRPIDNNVLNVVKAGRAIPVKFSLDGNKGLDIFAVGYPKSKVISCGLTSMTIEDEETMTAGDSSLNYDADVDQYVYVWKTDKAWAGDCRQLEVKLNDGQSYCANFQFK